MNIEKIGTEFTIDTVLPGFVVTADDASPTDIFAARELAYFLSKITGTEFGIQHHISNRGFNFLIGDSILSAEERNKLPKSETDSVEIITVNKHTYLIKGDGPAGNLYAVYELLDYLGCRWYHPKAIHIPALKDLSLPKCITRTPSFEYRELLWYTACGDSLWALRNRLNGNFHNTVDYHGDQWCWKPYVHSFHHIFPPDRFADKHPEYYSFRTGQGRITHNAQICLSNPNVLSNAKEFVLRQMEDPAVRIVDVSQNDCASPCQCPECNSKKKLYHSTSGVVIDFVNRIAETTSKKYPDKFVGTLAYTYTQRPPKNIKAHENVIVRLCHMSPSCDSHPLDSCIHNRQYIEDLNKWSKIVKHLYVWHYVTNFLHPLMFHPNFDALARDLKFYHDIGVKGVFLQGLNQKGVSFEELHSYVQSRLLWNSDLNYYDEAESFCRHFYGDAGIYIFDMIQIIHENARKGFHSNLYTHPQTGIFTRLQIKKLRGLMSKAMSAVKENNTYRERIETIGLYMDYTDLNTAEPLKKELGNFIFKAAPDSENIFNNIKHGLKKLGITCLQEFPAEHQSLGEKCGWWGQSRKYPVSHIENDFMKIEIVPDLAGMACSLFDKKTGTDIFCKPAPWILRYPTMGGYTEGISSDGFGPGFLNAFKITNTIDQSPHFITLYARLKHNIHVQRTFYLNPDKNELIIDSIYKNCGHKDFSLELHSFSLLSMGDLKSIVFFGNGHDNVFKKIDNVPEDDNVEAFQWVFLEKKTLPVGKWGCFNKKSKIGIIENFGNQSMRFCLSNGYSVDQRVLMETLAKPKKLQPGHMIKSSRKFEVIHNIYGLLPS